MSRTTDLFKGLMFLQGHFTRPDDLDPSFPLGNRAASDRWFAGNAGAGADKPATGLNLLEHLSFLGGRPMHAGHNLDIDEPFEQFATVPAQGAANDDALRQCASC